MNERHLNTGKMLQGLNQKLQEPMRGLELVRLRMPFEAVVELLTQLETQYEVSSVKVLRRERKFWERHRALLPARNRR